MIEEVLMPCVMISVLAYKDMNKGCLNFIQVSSLQYEPSESVYNVMVIMMRPCV